MVNIRNPIESMMAPESAHLLSEDINGMFEMRGIFLIDFIVEELDCSKNNCLRRFENTETHD